MTSTEDIGEATTPEVSNVALGALETQEDAADAILARWGNPDASEKKPSEETEGKTSDKEDDHEQSTEGEATEEETSDESPEGETEEEAPKKKYADDDETYVKIPEGDKEHEVKVKDLKRLWGQEAALTRKSQEVAAARTKADAETARAATALTAMVKRAQEASQPFKELNFLALAKDPNISADDLAALQKEAVRVHENERFLTGELDNFMKAVQEQKTVATREAAKVCVQQLKDKDSPSHIADWSDKLYDDLRGFAVSEGIHQDVVNQLTDAPTFKLLHMAMMYKKGLSKSTTVKVNKQPKKIVKTTSTVQPRKGTDAERKKAMQNLRETGSTDSAAEAFLARWKSNED
jgi:hypothetical protein